MKSFKNHWPIIATILFLWIIVVGILVVSCKCNDGKLVYILDDPYIHMAMAENFAVNGTWGINDDQFSSSSSSPLWTLLIAIFFKLFGTNEIIPLILNILAASLVLIIVYKYLYQYSINKRLVFSGLIIILWAAPLPALIYTGMEHVLHTLFALLFVNSASKFLAYSKYPDNNETSNTSIPSFSCLLVLAAIITSIRYESLFMVFIVCVYLFVQRKLWLALILGLTALIPPGLTGLISKLQGWYFLPNSVMLKGNIPDFSTINSLISFVFRDVIQLFDHDVMFILVSVALVLYLLNRLTDYLSNGYHIPALIIFLFTSWFHLQFAETGWYFRYEGYLVVLGIFAIILSFGKLNINFAGLKKNGLKAPSLIALTALSIIVLYPLFLRGAYSSYYIIQSTHNIYNQQYQMGRFLDRYYKGKPIIINDIGMVSYHADIETIDIWGLASIEVAEAIKNNYYTLEFIEKLANEKGTPVAVIYDDINRMYNSGGIPDSWHKVGWWTIPNNIACYNETVSFYAIDEAEIKPLRNFLTDYSKSLPPDVSWELE